MALSTLICHGFILRLSPPFTLSILSYPIPPPLTSPSCVLMGFFSLYPYLKNKFSYINERVFFVTYTISNLL